METYGVYSLPEMVHTMDRQDLNGWGILLHDDASCCKRTR